MDDEDLLLKRILVFFAEILDLPHISQARQMATIAFRPSLLGIDLRDSLIHRILIDWSLTIICSDIENEKLSSIRSRSM